MSRVDEVGSEWDTVSGGVVSGVSPVCDNVGVGCAVGDEDHLGSGLPTSIFIFILMVLPPSERGELTLLSLSGTVTA